MAGYGAGAQSYIKQLIRPELSVRQKITRFSNGDLLIGDSAPQESGTNGTAPLYLTRMDGCGNIVWSRAFERKGIQLAFRDLAIDDRERIFVVGSAIDGLRESLFLLEVDGKGENRRFENFDSDVPSISSFSMSLRGDRILIFGRLLEIGSPITGYLALFDTRLNFQWGRKIRPFVFEGAAIIGSENDLIARSRAFHYRFDRSGELLWAREFERALEPEPIAGPVEVAGGYLFKAFSSGEAFFYKLNPQGEIIWTSPLFPSTPFPAVVQELPGGNLIAHYSAPGAIGNRLCRLTLSPAGQVLKQMQLDSDRSFNVGSIHHSFADDQTVNVIGNEDALIPAAVDLTNYLLQFPAQGNAPDCINWSQIKASAANNYRLTLPSVTGQIAGLQLQSVVPGSLFSYAIESPYGEVCSAVPEPVIIRTDTLLPCRENWTVALPSVAFNWDDRYPELQRTLETSGLFRARNDDCTNPVIYEFELQRADCDCRVFLPNAFSPNADGQNDTIELYSDCRISKVEASVYDRWGNLIYRSRTPEQVWDGTARQGLAPQGAYVLIISYQLLSGSGTEHEGQLSQEVILVR